MKILGIDPGTTGALALIDTTMLTLAVTDMPIEGSVKGRNITSSALLFHAISQANPDHIFLEEVHAMKGEGPVGAFSFGRGVGRIEGVSDALAIPRTSVRPQEWKSKLNVKADKDQSTTRASQLFPCAVKVLYGPRGGAKHGRAEAAMLALFGCLKLGIIPNRLTLAEFP